MMVPGSARIKKSGGKSRKWSLTMTDRADDATRNDTAPAAAPVRRSPDDLPPAARRALQEAEARRRAAEAEADGRPREIDGRGGLEPVRYGDWEIKGLTADF